MKRVFQPPDHVFDEIKNMLQSNGLIVYSRKDHPYHFILEIGTKEKKVGRIKCHYNKFFKCTSVEIIDAMDDTYPLLVRSFEMRKMKGDHADELARYLINNYRFQVSVIYRNHARTCYEVRVKAHFVWINVANETALSCTYVRGDLDFFDEVYDACQKFECIILGK